MEEIYLLGNIFAQNFTFTCFETIPQKKKVFPLPRPWL